VSGILGTRPSIFRNFLSYFHVMTCAPAFQFSTALAPREDCSGDSARALMEHKVYRSQHRLNRPIPVRPVVFSGRLVVFVSIMAA
jgi:hypothetical protein